jgi:predicted amidohydrolase YtcJ
VQFAEKRLPTLAELDAIAPGNPVYLQVSFTGPAATNTLGRAFFQSRGIAVSTEGVILANAPTVAALNALRSVQTFDDKKRGTLDALAYSAALGVTTNFDMGGFLIPGSPDHEDEFTFDGAASWDPYTAYDPLLDVYRMV